MGRIVYFIRLYILQPLSLKKQEQSPKYDYNNFFMSFGDAFLYLMNAFKINKENDYILLPNFYCIDTINFIGQRGRLIFYKIKDDFSVDKNDYFQQIEKFKPRVIINYSFSGFKLDTNEVERLKKLAGSAIIIEDFAQSVLTNDRVKFYTDRHFYIDSIRKISPCLGAHLLSPQEPPKTPVELINFYKFRSYFLRLTSNFFNFIAYISNIGMFYRLGHKIFLALNSIIGEHPRPTKGCLLSFYLYNKIDIDRLIKHAQEITAHYTYYLGQINSDLINILATEKLPNEFITYYPVFVDKKIQPELIKYLATKKIFADSLWDISDSIYSQEINLALFDKFIFFPITWLINEKDVKRVASEVNNFLKKYA